ncbi:MAG: ABC transporter permease [Planctomycetes bacterium]|nr:ABC transporter permease [Planctomycetota bacterium]
MMRELGELLRELWADRRRLFLVVVALGWGTLGLTVLLGFGHGFDRAMVGVLRESGDRMLRLSGGATTVPAGGLPAGRPVPLAPEDAAALRALPGVRLLSLEYTVRARVTLGAGEGPNARVHGVDDAYAEVRGIRVRGGGRFLSPIDGQERRRVAVLGDRIARDLFGAADPIGRTLLVSGQPFSVAGVLAPRITVMTYNGQDDDKIFVPATTLRALFGLRNPSFVVLEAARAERSAELVQEVRRTLAARLRFDPGDRAAVAIRDHAAQAREIGALILGIRLFLGIVGVLGLLVAAVGVANIMHALVDERVREIGLRLALGARPLQIRARALLEAALLVAVGGGGGLGLASLLLLGLDALPLDRSVRAYLGSPVPSLPVAAGIAALLGACALVAGWHPARRAAAVQPVEALRHA